jgi:outer membrane immunogenic protein
MKSRVFAATTALAGSIAFGGIAVAADLDGKPTRNWGGTWFGFGAGYSNSAYKGDLGSTTCFTGASGSGSHESQAGCDASFDGTGGGVGVGARAETIGNNPSVADSSAAVAIAPPNYAAGTAAAGGTFGPGVNTSVDVDASVPSASTSAFGDDAASTPQTATNGTGGDLVTGIQRTEVNYDYEAESVTFYDPSSGVFGAAASAAASSTDGSASAFALGLGGLPGGGFSDNNGGFTPNIHMRIDHQTESNWVFGGELDLLFPTGSDLTVTRETEVALRLDDAPVNEIDLAANQAVSVDTNLLATARLRMGYAMGDYLFYGTGGVAYADLDAEAAATGAYGGLYGNSEASVSQSKSAHAWGGVVGGGVSAFMNDDTVVSLEGLYYMFDETINVGDGAVKLDDAFSVMVKVSIRPN